MFGHLVVVWGRVLGRDLFSMPLDEYTDRTERKFFKIDYGKKRRKNVSNQRHNSLVIYSEVSSKKQPTSMDV